MGFSQRRVRAGRISLEESIARPMVDRSLGDEYIFPPLYVVLVSWESFSREIEKEVGRVLTGFHRPDWHPSMCPPRIQG